MKILIVNNTKIPAFDYGGIERVIWWLGKELARLGHKVVYLVAPGSSCPFADVLAYDPAVPLEKQIPQDIDIVHSQFQFKQEIHKPYIISHHVNTTVPMEYDVNTVFSSRNHAQRNGSDVFVYNGLDCEAYGPIDLSSPRRNLLFLAYARRPEKNVAACKRIARSCGIPLAIIGGRRNFFNSRFGVEYKGYLGGEARNSIMRDSKALLYPVRWHEPFGVAIIEALYFGCPVFGTPYGSLPEIITGQVGYLSDHCSELILAVKNTLRDFKPRDCHEYVRDHFNSRKMTKEYLALYEKILSGESLNPQKPQSRDVFNSEKLLPFFN